MEALCDERKEAAATMNPWHAAFWLVLLALGLLSGVYWYSKELSREIPWGPERKKRLRTGIIAFIIVYLVIFGCISLMTLK
jgi:hypothetical protein